MSNPGINRWGLNLFWYRLWYNDKITPLIIHQDHLINKFILIYLHYGLLHPKNFFINKYWYPETNQLYKNYYLSTNAKYFRTLAYKNRATGEKYPYQDRIKSKNLYFSKIWILRYQNWLIINFYCFQPLKTKITNRKIWQKSLDTFLENNQPNKALLFRYKLILFYTINFFLTSNTYYHF